MPNGKTTELEVIRHPGAAAMVPLADSDEVLLVRQYRYATGGWLLEVPAGKLDRGEDPEACAVRELEEEVGMKPAKVIPLGWIWTTPGFTDEKIWLYLCRDLRPAQQDLQDDEVLTVESRSLEEAIEMVRQGEICDSKSICALLQADAYLRAED
jgi:ADP-ribose pyrophosphatase